MGLYLHVPIHHHGVVQGHLYFFVTQSYQNVFLCEVV